jgi:hypothetical protein
VKKVMQDAKRVIDKYKTQEEEVAPVHRTISIIARRFLILLGSVCVGCLCVCVCKHDTNPIGVRTGCLTAHMRPSCSLQLPPYLPRFEFHSKSARPPVPILLFSADL